MPGPAIDVSFVLATCDRRDVLRETLLRLNECGLEPGTWETWVVDNGSTDGTVDDLLRAPDHVHAVMLPDNRGACAKDYALPRVNGRIVVFLDDDSWPIDDSMPRLLERFDRRPRLGAAGFDVILPGNRREGSALPDVFVGCGVGFQAAALRAVGGIDRTLFMIAEEYDLTFRLVRCGYEVAVFDDLRVMHLKAPMTRNAPRRAYYDMRNNMLLGWTYLPAPWHVEYLLDWRQRYTWLAERCDATDTAWRAWCAGRRLGRLRRRRRPHARLDRAAFRQLFRWPTIERGMARLHDRGLRRIVLADLGKNLFAYYRAARLAGLDILAVVDDGWAAPGRRYRDIRLLDSTAAAELAPDAVVVANSSPVHADTTAARLRATTATEVVHWPLRPTSCRAGVQQSTAPGV